MIKEEKCITNSTNRHEIKECFNDANSKRKIMGEELRKEKTKNMF